MSVRDMSDVPKDRPILLKTKEGWCQGKWDEHSYHHERDDYGAWHFIRLPEHGCGCCSTNASEPTAWMELP